MPKTLTLIVGGARSGKSTLAEGLASHGTRVLYVATAEPGDDEMRVRIAKHRERRPPDWDTLEAPRALASSLNSTLSGYDICLIDCLTLWVSNLILDLDSDEDREHQAVMAAKALLDVFECSNASWIVVSNEVGQGIVPATSLGRVYRDALGRVNQIIASRADRVFLAVAGLALEVKALGARSTLDPHHNVMIGSTDK